LFSARSSRFRLETSACRRLGPSADSVATLDAWIDPPIYTGEAPIYLAKGGPHTISVPQDRS